MTKLYQPLLIALLVVSVLMIIIVLMQPSKNNSAATALSGGAEELFGKQKARGFEAVLQRITVILGILFIGLALVLAYISSK